jgi:hypothetical protein
MEETGRPGRITCEGRGMSASTQEFDMNSKQLILGAAVATVLALTSPAYAGHLGGAGAFGGSLGGSLGGAGGAGRLTGAGGFDSQGDLNGAVNKKAVSKTTDKAATAAKADGIAAAKTEGTAATPTPAGAKPPTKAAPESAKPGASTSLTGGADQSVAAGSHTVSGGADGSLNAQHAKGSTSAAAAGDASGSLN